MHDIVCMYASFTITGIKFNFAILFHGMVNVVMIDTMTCN
jgi:hypothetical protein